jgi:hypothetical protein
MPVGKQAIGAHWFKRRNIKRRFEMRKRVIVFGILMVVALTMMAPGALAGGAYRGSAEDPLYPELGLIEYLSNPAGYHFWFTVSEDLAWYEAGHSYHNVYKLKVDDPDEWCGTVTVGGGGRAPYNLVGHQGETAYFKIFDTTTDTQVCP